MNHYDILIATPGSSMESEYVNSLVSTLAECTKRGISFKFLNAKGSLIHRVREATCSGGGNVKLNPNDRGPMGDSVTYNKIFWIDSDISWEPWQFFKIYDSEYDVCSGAYLWNDGDSLSSSVHGFEKNRSFSKEEILKMSNPIKVQSVGFGFIAMKYGVFEKINRPWFKHFVSPIHKKNGETIYDSLGEDVSWCINASNSGIDIYFDPKVLVSHIKRVELKW